VIEQADDLLTEWAGEVLPRATVSLARPKEERPGSGVSIHLLDLVEGPMPRGVRRPTVLQMSLRYLVTTWAKDERAAHRLLGELAFAAIDHEDFELDLEPLPSSFWEAVGVTPRPHVLLRVPVRRERPEPVVKRVEEPLVVHTTGMTKLEGVIVGPGDVPVPDAFIELPELQRYTRSDGKGRFAFSGLPADPPVGKVRIHAKGRDFSLRPDGSVDGRGMLIELDFVEA
jgi:hypothetical protein